MKTYLIKYRIHFTDKSSFSRETRVKNCISSAHAQSRLEDYLKRKHSDFTFMTVASCAEDVFCDMGAVGDIFRDIFKR